MTERLYNLDSNLLEFEARIVETGSLTDRFYTVLDRSAFYPTSGGQLHDTGRLNEIEVVEVVESENNEVWHFSQVPVGKVGDSVQGTVDKERRRRQCRSHTAQHILSAAFFKLYELETVSVHLGQEYAAVELSTGQVSDEQLAAAEQFANTVTADNIPVEILFTDSDQVDSLPFRRMPKRTGKLRVVRIGEIDCTACGGTHCNATAEVGLVKILGLEKIRGRPLVKFLSGQLAVTDYAIRFEVTDRLSRLFTCHVTDLPNSLEKISAENKQLRIDLAQAHRELLPVKAQQLAAAAATDGALPYVATVVAGLEPSLTGKLAGQVADLIEGLAVLLVEGRLVIAVGKTSGLNAGDLARRLAAEAGLKGGGNNRVAQLGGADADSLNDYRKLLLGMIADA